MFHQSFYPHLPNQFYKPAQSSHFQSTPRTNRSSQNLHFSRDMPPPPPHGFTSSPKGPYPFWRQNMGRYPRQYPRTSAFHFQDKSTFYYMSDPIVTHDNRITIQLTKVHIGLNGDQQRVFVEQEFSHENELKKFVKNLRANFEKTFDNHDDNQSTCSKKTGVIVIEEPDEEPKVYQQQQDQRLPLLSSCSTIRLNKRRRNKMKYQRQYHKSPGRFQKENESPLPPNYNPQGRSNRYQQRAKDQGKPPPFRRIIAENLVFPNNKQQHIRVDRSKSNCQGKLPQYFDYQQHPMVYPFRKTQIQFRLFNPYQPTF